MRDIWPTNIGNAFIVFGSIQSLKMAAPKSQVHFISEFSRYLSEETFKRKLIKKIPKSLANYLKKKYPSAYSSARDATINKSHHQKYFNLSEHIKADYVVFSGMIDSTFISSNFELISTLKKRGTKIILNGIGGGYSKREIELFRDFFKLIKPHAFISRDEESYKNFNDLIEHSYNGIDCGFFLNDYFSPDKLDIPKYTVLNFDRTKEPNIQVKNKMVIRTHHRFWPDIPKHHLKKPNTFISDWPEDYLNIYANADETHSDRVHACLATLIYGNPCRLYYKTKRALLFDRLGLDSLRYKLITANLKEIKKEKKKQIVFLKRALNRK